MYCKFEFRASQLHRIDNIPGLPRSHLRAHSYLNLLILGRYLSFFCSMSVSPIITFKAGLCDLNVSSLAP